jgi:hypothetical protein
MDPAVAVYRHLIGSEVNIEPVVNNIPLVPVYEILEKHNLCFESILHNSVDYKVLAQNAQGINYNLPERYQHLANSSRRSSLYMLDYIGQRYGQLNRLSILRKLQLNEATFCDPDAKNNILLPLDICKSLFEHGSKQDIIGMGMHFSNYAKDSEVASFIQKARSVPEAYEIMFSGVLEKYVEKNFIWSLKNLNSDFCILSGILNPEARELGSQIINQHMCLLRLGFISNITRFINAPTARVKKISCLAKGDASCDYHIFFSKNAIIPFHH